MSLGSMKVRFGLCLVLTLAFGTPLSAQGDPNRRQELFESLLQSLIDSQMNLSTSQQPAPQPISQFGPQPLVTPSSLPNGTVQPTAQLRDVRRIAASLSQETGRLFETLNRDIRQNPGLATHFNSTIRVNANAAVLAQRSERSWEMASLKPDYIELDREWRLLAYQLNNTPGLSTACQTSIRTIDGLNLQLSKLFDVNPQIDSQKFQRLTEALEVDLQNLMEEISLEMGWSDNTRQLLLMGRLVEQQARYMAYNQELRNNRERAVAEYQKFQQLWAPYATQLWPLKNRYVDRHVQRIEQIDRDLQQVLLIPVTLNHQQLARLSDTLQTDAMLLFEQATLADLVKLDNPANLITTSKGFTTAITRLRDSINRKRDLAQLQTEFRTVEQNWRGTADAFRTTTKPETLRLIRNVDATLVSLTNNLQIRNVFDRPKALQLIAALENYGKHLQDDYSTYVVQGGRYERGFAYQGLHTCHQFTAFANNIHQSLADGASPADVRERVDVLARGWTFLNNEYLLKLQGAERDRLARLAGEITPQMVQLQTMFEF